MIVSPRIDKECLGPISEAIAHLAANADPAALELASRYRTMGELVADIRARPQRDDLGNPDEYPRVHECSPAQRTRVVTKDPNCLERVIEAALIGQINWPEHTYEMATVDTPLGLHVVLLVDGVHLPLDPRVSDDCIECGLALAADGPVAVEPRKAVAWTVDMAAQAAPATRNGPGGLYVGKTALRRLLDRGAVPEAHEVDAMGFLFALAERAARRYGPRAMGIVRTATRAVADILDIVLAKRNAHIDIGGLQFDTPHWLDETAGALGSVGLGLGSAYVRAKLAALDLPALIGMPGATDAILGLVESELGDRGRTLGPLAHPPRLATFAKFAAPREA